jgi:NAD(P)-dependent dehydrogenase (short-subunit alcohol dehydrogenase family)
MANLFDLSNTTAVVTGSSRGIGRATARTLLRQGASVVVNGYDAAETESSARELGAEFEAARVVPGDVTDPATASSLVDAARQAFGRLDHVVCNAGIDIIKPAVDYTPEEWDRVLAVNLRGAFLPAQAAARHWIEAGQPGSITFTSSIAGSVGIPTLAPYAASKGGINQLVRTLAAEWAEHSIRVNAVAPGYVANIMEGVTAHNGPASDQRINIFTPLGRRATVEEVAAPYAFLAAPAANYITGSILSTDGGYTAI